MQFIKYLAVGLANTLVGYGVFFSLAHYSAVPPEIANALGYALALIVAFSLNRIFVFKSSIQNSKALPKFIAASSLSFAINQLVLVFFLRLLNWPAELSQLPAMASYTLVFYYLNKNFVFSDFRSE
jgi:putative flippase GtrA